MDRADTCRRAARDAVADVDPPRLHDVIADVLDDASMVPGALTLESAASIDPGADLEAIAHRAAGVQLIYEGLRLTRTLAHEEPWSGADDGGDSDLEVLAADILVARGFYLLARTDAADKAVRTVRNFGRDQTLRDDAAAADEADDLDANLERDVLELAVLTGAAAVGATPAPESLAAAHDLAAGASVGFPPADECLPALDADEPDAEAETPPNDGVPTDRATSATDP
ncbi:DUF7114 family protein [Salinilacihabitans rarus]|uniref:DUF7114 family protein n=1 Tax=Salinilacihabitans rarus TaxID=2961596 RepID=UPI0020C8EE33|nr:hypothetical protein [Salinilacihabitans rarus]